MKRDIRQRDFISAASGNFKAFAVEPGINLIEREIPRLKESSSSKIHEQIRTRISACWFIKK